MRRWLLIIVISCGVAACAKTGSGYYSLGQNTAPVTAKDTVTTNYYFNNVIIDSNTNDTFNIRLLTQAIIDSGTVTVTFRSSIVWLNTWFTLPTYTFPDGSVVTVFRVGLQPGKAILRASGGTTPAMDYCFAVSDP